MSQIITAKNPSRLPWEMTLAEIIDAAAERHPEKVFLRYDKYDVTYGQFQETTRKAAQAFSRLGVGRGDRVCLFLPNGREVLFIWMGLARLGAICVTVNTAYKQDETAYIINNSESKVLVTHESLLDVARSAAAQCPSLEASVLVSGGGSPSPQPSPGGRGRKWLDFWELMDSAPGEDPPSQADVAPDDVAMLVYTSGTTGNPKGVMLTHSMFAASGQGFATWTESTPDERFFTCMPYFHANAQYYSTMGTLCLGATLTVVDRFSASRFWDQVRESESTVVNFIGMMMPVLLKQDPSPSDRDNDVRLFYGSPAMAPEMLEEFERRFGAAVLIGFGMTETCYGTIERLGEPHRQGSSGKPRWHPDPRFQNELRIVDDSGVVQPPGVPGEITLRNPAVMPGYWRNPERTSESLREGWLHTGDLGWVDEDGHLYFVDRKKDVVRRRGENISSQQVEDIIKRHPGVMDCAVIAVPSELGEEEVKAYVVHRKYHPLQTTQQETDDETTVFPADEMVDLTPEDVVYWAAERLAYFKVPRYIEMREDLPRTPSLRVRKDVLRGEREDLTAGCFDREAAGIRLGR